MSDVDGIYTLPPSQEGAKLLWTFTSGMQNSIQFGSKSSVGTGGMDSKVIFLYKAFAWKLIKI